MHSIYFSSVSVHRVSDNHDQYNVLNFIYIKTVQRLAQTVLKPVKLGFNTFVIFFKKKLKVVENYV